MVGTYLHQAFPKATSEADTVRAGISACRLRGSPRRADWLDAIARWTDRSTGVPYSSRVGLMVSVSVGQTRRGRLLVVSHACVLPVNQHVYARLAELGWDLTLVAPARWRHDYGASAFASAALPVLAERFVPLPVVLAGRPQRHLYRTRLGALIRTLSPDLVVLEEETYSLPAAQWALALGRAAIPYGVQADENLDRRLPLPGRAARAYTLPRAAFVMARSPTAARLALRWGARGRIELIPHAVPHWPRVPKASNRAFTIGYAGRFVPEKGIYDLISAAALLEPPVKVLLVGDGPLREDLKDLVIPNGSLEIRTGVGHDEMPFAYGQMDVLVLPSRTTRRWAEQFGRVLVEALWCGVPVVGSDSGEIPWVIETTGGGPSFRKATLRRWPVFSLGFVRTPLARMSSRALEDRPRSHASE